MYVGIYNFRNKPTATNYKTQAVHFICFMAVQILTHLFVLFQLVHQSQLMLKHYNATLLKQLNWNVLELPAHFVLVVDFESLTS